MQAFIVTTIIGVFGVDENKRIVLFKPFPKDPIKIAEKVRQAEIEISEEEKELMKELWNRGFKDFVYSVHKSGVKKVESNNPAEKYIKDNLRRLAIEKKFVADDSDFNQLITRINLELTKLKITKAISRDHLVMQAIGASEELDKSINIFVERLREMYGLHFPEMDRIISDHKKYAKLVEKFGLREKIDDPSLEKIKDKSMGAELTPADVNIIQEFATKIIQLYDLREDISKYLETLLGEVAPNTKEIAGPMLAAKLIAKAGGLEKLAKMPSSTMQLIGAEKALFRHLHSKGKIKSPKYGLLFSHPLIQNAPQEKRGKIARLLASKLSMATKFDFYSKVYKADGLKKDLQERVKETLSSN